MYLEPTPLELRPPRAEFAYAFNAPKPARSGNTRSRPTTGARRPPHSCGLSSLRWADELLVFQPATRSFHIRMYDRSAGPAPPALGRRPRRAAVGDGQPFPGAVVGHPRDGAKAASLAYLGGELLLAHAPGFDLGAALEALHRYDRTALGDSGGAPRALRSLGSGTWTGPRDTLQYTYVGADTLLEVNPTTCRYHLRRLVRPDDAPAPAPRCTSCPSSASSAPAVGLTIAADVRSRLLTARCAPSRAQAAACAPAARMRLVRVGRRAWRGSATGGCYCDCDTWRWGRPRAGRRRAVRSLETCSACVERPWCSWCSTTQSCHGGGKHKASGELCLEWHELACPKLPLELVYEQPAFARALMPCHATDSDPKAHPWDLALLETGGADC